MPQPVRILKARFKFKSTIPLHLEYALQNLYGYNYFAQKRNEWRMYEKYEGDGSPSSKVDYSDLSEETINHLTRQVNRIAGCFANPDEHKNVIKIRCTNMARTLGPRERQWVLDWIVRNIDEDEDYPDEPEEQQLPWTSEDGPIVKEH